jgi:25S rRNA (adenine2142-N1)-methyltransferase
VLVESLQAQIEAAGGLRTYQRASEQGQSATRGGDSSRILVNWMEEVLRDGESLDGRVPGPKSAPNVSKSISTLSMRKLRLLEVGALRTDNVCARSGWFDIVRIDLRSQHPEVIEQDFMQRPLPKSAEALVSEGFDVISLSLVLNYVTDATERGKMLERTAKFLRHLNRDEGSLQGMLPGVFVVLPAPCVCNSRYLDEERLLAIMQALGYDLVRKKYTNKLAYFYWRLSRQQRSQDKYLKKEVARGAGRNNFAIVLE